MWIIGWTKQAIFDLGQLPYKSHLLNFPYGYNLAVTEISPLQILIALPFTLITNNPILGFNIAILSTFTISGLTMYYWVLHLTKSNGASLVASTAFAFLPYHSIHFLSGHLNLSGIQWFPLYFMGFIEILNSEKFNFKYIVILSVGLSGIALTSQYYLFMTLFISAVISLIFLIHKRHFFKWIIWRQFIICGLLSLPSLILGIVPYFLIHRVSSSLRPLEDVMVYSAGIADYFLPFTKSLIAGGWVSNNFPRDLWNEATLYLGLPVFILAVFGYIKLRKSDKRQIAGIMGLIALIAFIVSLGTNLTWMENPVILKTPYFLKTLINQEYFKVLLPGYLLYKYFPFYNIMRVWMRYGIIVMTITCALVGIGTHELSKNFAKLPRKIIIFVILGLVLIDFMPTHYKTVEVRAREVDDWLAEQPFGGQVQLPLKNSYEQSSIYFTLINQKPLIGMMNTFPSNRYFKMELLLRNFPDKKSMELINREKITYVIISESDYDVTDGFIKDCQKYGLLYGGSFDGQSVFINVQ